MRKQQAINISLAPFSTHMALSAAQCVQAMERWQKFSYLELLQSSLTLAWNPSKGIQTRHESRSTANPSQTWGASKASHLPAQDHFQSNGAS